VILQTERLTLRPMQIGDADDVFRIMSDVEVMAHWDTAEIQDPDVVAGMIAAQVAEIAAGRAFYWAMTHDGFTLGVCDLSDIDRRHRRAEIGFILGRDAWGRGFGLEAMRAVVTYAASLGLKRLSARTHVGNERSEAILDKLGFEPEGYLRGHIQRGGERRDCRIYGLLL
jgi:ribosomal-protein-alanine N-acetyltransferase